jgi:hypothetical protein
MNATKLIKGDHVSIVTQDCKIVGDVLKISYVNDVAVSAEIVATSGTSAGYVYAWDRRYDGGTITKKEDSNVN